MRTEIRLCAAGDRSVLAVLALPSALEFKELRQSTDYREDILRIAGSLAEFDRTEIVYYDGDKVVGGATIVLDDDQHVGVCLSLQWQYVLPAYRGKNLGAKFIRELKRQAQWAGIGNICYTHRTGIGRYEVVYRETDRSSTYGTRNAHKGAAARIIR